MDMLYPFSEPLYVMAKPAGAACNLRCRYCYYLEKAKLFTRQQPPVMSDELLEKYIKEYIGCQSTPDVLFCWHGGEPLLRPLNFYKKALKLQRQYANGKRISNIIQTNGTLINDEWARFFKQNNFLIGVSIDGPKELHDRYRLNTRSEGSWERVMRGIRLLQKYDVDWNAMAVVNDVIAEHPLEFYRFFKSIDCHYIQFTPIVERIKHHDDGRHLANPLDGEEPQLAPFSVTPKKWGDFLCAVFDEWVRNDVGTFFVQIFDSTLANWIGEQPSVCTMAKNCGHAAVMEHNGDFYSCDHFVFPEYRLGNIMTDSIISMMKSERQLKFGRAKHDSLPSQCQECEWLFACNGECPKNRFCKTPTGERGLNYLCEGYRQFFSHAAPAMDFMKNQLLNQLPPAAIMDFLKG
jgi:uncharacterized protein